MARKVRSISATDTMRYSDEALNVTAGSGGVTVNLPPANSARKNNRYRITKVDAAAGAVTITPNGSDTIAQLSTKALNFRFQSIDLQSDGASNWDIVSVAGPIVTNPTLNVAEGVSPSYKNQYVNIAIPASVIGGTQTIKGMQSWLTLAASSAPGEVFGVYGNVVSSGAPAGAYGVVGEFDNVLSTPSGVGVGVMGTYDGVTAVTATPGATGLFSAAVCGQVWDRNTAGPTACILALINGDTNRQSGNPVGAAFKAINRCISFATGFNYGIDFYVESPFTRGALKGEVRMNTGAVVASGTAANRAAVRTQLGDGALPALGSLYLSTTAGKLYFKRANGSADTDWYLVTISDTD